jgi:LysM repeat protein
MERARSYVHSPLEPSGFGLYAARVATLNAFSDNTLTGCAKGPVHIGANGVGQLGSGTYSPNAVPAIYVENESVARDASWLALDAPYAFPSGFSIGGSQIASAHVTVSAGTTLQLSGSVSVSNGGGLTLAGTPDKHVTLTCGKPACSPGDWVEIDLYGASVDAYNVFTYVDVAYGGGASYGQVWVDAGATLALDHTTFSHSGSTNACDVYVVNTTTSTLNASSSTYSVCAH